MTTRTDARSPLPRAAWFRRAVCAAVLAARLLSGLVPVCAQETLPRLSGISNRPHFLLENTTRSVTFACQLSGADSSAPAVILYRTDHGGEVSKKLGPLEDQGLTWGGRQYEGAYPVTAKDGELLYYTAETTVDGKLLRSPVSLLWTSRFPYGQPGYEPTFLWKDPRGLVVPVSRTTLRVQFELGTSEDVVERIVGEQGGKVLNFVSAFDQAGASYVIQVPDMTSMDEIEARLEKLKAYKEVLFVMAREDRGRVADPGNNTPY